MASGHQFGQLALDYTLNGGALIPDPGDGEQINVNRSLGVCELTIGAGSETRTLPDPTVGTNGMGIGTRVLVVANQISGGSCTLEGVTFATEGQFAEFVVATVNGAKAWIDTATLVDLTVSGDFVVGGATLLATGFEINRVCDRSSRVIDITSSTATISELTHDSTTIVLDRAAGIAVTLPAAAAGLVFTFIVKTTFSGAASIKSATGADIMIGHAIMGNNTDNSVVNWQATAADTFDTIDLLGTANSTGGMAGQIITIRGLAANLWHVVIIGDAAGTEATPFANTVT